MQETIKDYKKEWGEKLQHECKYGTIKLKVIDVLTS